MTDDNSLALEEPILETHEVGVRYDETQVALHGVDLAFARGQVTALIGPSGCGKSTFLRCLNLMNREIPHCHVDGQIRFEGREVNTKEVDLFALRRAIGMVFQIPNPFRKSIRDNITFALKHHGVRDRTRLDEVVEESLRRAALWDEVKDKLDTSALALSGGQQQRLCIARALATGPRVLLMDEPCSALDPISTYKIEDTIASIAGQGICVIIVTHNIEQAARVSDSMAFFLLGEVIEWGPTERLFSRPQDRRTEDYLTGRFG